LTWNPQEMDQNAAPLVSFSRLKLDEAYSVEDFT
jgi:hypothetical protein